MFTVDPEVISVYLYDTYTTMYIMYTLLIKPIIPPSYILYTLAYNFCTKSIVLASVLYMYTVHIYNIHVCKNPQIHGLNITLSQCNTATL